MEAFCHQDSFLSLGVAAIKLVTVYPKCYNLSLFSLVPNPSKHINPCPILPQQSLLLLVTRILHCFHATCFSGASHCLCHPATPAGTKHAPSHPKFLQHCPYLQITLWGSLARACANLLAMSSDRYFTPAPKETRTKPFS